MRNLALAKIFQSKNIVLGVSGGIAAYKALDLVSRFKKLGANVDVIMTKSATEFVQPLSFQSLAQTAVVTDLFDSPKYFEIEHISLAKKADIFLIAPATANIIAKIKNGIADDFLSTTIMATTAPVLIAPAMNTKMYENKIVQSNILALKELNYKFVEPAVGRLACADVGRGKLADVEDILSATAELLRDNSLLAGKKILITAGATKEAIDPVRFISNHSSGKMGYALAEKAVKYGAEVCLLSARTALSVPASVEVCYFQTARELHQLVMTKKDDFDVLISVAAVADYRPEKVEANKIKKDNQDLTIKLVRNPDIAYEVGQDKGELISVGFAAESENILENSLLKMKKKNFDLLIANDITEVGAGFGADTNIVLILSKDGSYQKIKKMPKLELAEIILERIADLLSEKND